MRLKLPEQQNGTEHPPVHWLVAWWIQNAVNTGYLVPATRGNKQLSAPGEQFVQALPDRERAKAMMAAVRPRRKARRTEEQAEEQAEES